MPALVIEGGAMRATYASGVAAALQDAGFVPDAIYGTSAGGAIGAWYAAGQADVGLKTWEKVTDRALMSFRRLVVGRKPVLDFRLLYGDYYPNFFGMDLAKLRASPFPVYATVVDADTCETLYPDLRDAKDPLALLHATSAIPLISESPVHVDGRRLVDGGLTTPIPLQKAIDDGHREIIAILNRPGGARHAEPGWASRLLGRKLPKLEQHARRHHEYHNAAVALAERPPAGTRVRIVRPSRETGVSRLTRDVKKLRAAIAHGRADGERVWAEMQRA